MKAVIKFSLIAAGAIGMLTADRVQADDSVTNLTAAPAPAESPQLSYGVPEIVKLTQAKISDSTVIAYIQSSGNSYGLDANQIIYLRQQGVSDVVINAMLTQPKPGSLAPATAPVAVSPDNTLAASAPSAPVAADPQTAVVSAPSTSVYVMPDSGPYPYYYPACYGYSYYAPVGISIGFGGRWGGGWHGGGYHGGNWGGGHGWHH